MDMELVTGGLLFPEGPIAISDGSVIVTEMERGTLTRIHPDGRQDVIADCGGGPNGAAIGCSSHSNHPSARFRSRR